MPSLREAHAFEQPRGAGFGGFGRARHSVRADGVILRTGAHGVTRPTGFSQCRHKDIFENRALRKEIMRLKDETNLPVAHGGELEIVKGREILSVEQHLSVRGPVQRADDLQQCANCEAKDSPCWRGPNGKLCK